MRSRTASCSCGQLRVEVQGEPLGVGVCHCLACQPCPVCGTTVFHTEQGNDRSVAVAVGAFADPGFPAPSVSVYEIRRHPWVRLPPGTEVFDKDPT
jgi:hypothetical protein